MINEHPPKEEVTGRPREARGAFAAGTRNGTIRSKEPDLRAPGSALRRTGSSVISAAFVVVVAVAVLALSSCTQEGRVASGSFKEVTRRGVGRPPVGGGGPREVPGRKGSEMVPVPEWSKGMRLDAAGEGVPSPDMPPRQMVVDPLTGRDITGAYLAECRDRYARGVKELFARADKRRVEGEDVSRVREGLVKDLKELHETVFRSSKGMLGQDLDIDGDVRRAQRWPGK